MTEVDLHMQATVKVLCLAISSTLPTQTGAAGRLGAYEFRDSLR